MKARSLTPVLFLSSLPLLGSCVIHIDGGCSGSTLRGSGVSATEERPVPEFTRVKLQGSVDLVASVGGPTRLTVTADDNLIQYIRTEVRDGTLVVSVEPGSYSFRVHAVAKVSTPELEAVTVAGSSDVDVAGLDGGDFAALVQGSGDIAAAGKIDRLDVRIEGSGDLDLFGLEAREARVRIDGSGDVELSVSERLDAEINGSGDIRYRGDPPRRATEVHGSGSIRRG